LLDCRPHSRPLPFVSNTRRGRELAQGAVFFNLALVQREVLRACLGGNVGTESPIDIDDVEHAWSGHMGESCHRTRLEDDLG